MASGSKARSARIDLTVGEASLDRGLASAGRKLRGFKREVSRPVASGGARSLANGMLGGLGSLAGMGGGLGLASIATDVMDVERALTRLQIATDATPAKMGELRENLNGISRSSGLARDQILAGAAAYVALTGDAAGAAARMELFAQVSNATGSAMTDIAATAAAMKDNLGIDPKDFAAGFSALAVQGKAGAVELRELSGLLASVAPSFAQFKGGGGAAGLAEMGASLQVIRKGFGSSSEAATGMRALMVSINRHAGDFQRAGVKIYDKDPKTGAKRLRDFSVIVDAIGASKLAKNPALLTKAFGSDEAKRAFDQLIANRGLLDELIAKSSDRSAIERDAATYQKSSAGRIEAAWNNIRLSVAEALTPERIAAFAKGMEAAARVAGKIAGYIEKAVGVGETLGHGAAILVGGHSPEAKANMAWADQQDKRVNLLMLQKGMTADAARQQVNSEDSARSMLRTGKLDYQGPELLKIQRDVAANKVWSNREELLTAFDNAIARAEKARAAAPVNVTVQIGQDAIAKASANAAGNRTRAGGL
jgi:hypothetical protein